VARATGGGACRCLEDNRAEFLAEKRRQENQETEARRQRAAAWRDAHERQMAELRNARLSAKREEAKNNGSGDAASSETSGGDIAGASAAASPWARVLALVDAPGERAHSHAAQSRARAFYATLSRRAQADAPAEH
jgi:hypothetical protein